MTPNPCRARGRVLFSVIACAVYYPQARRFVKRMGSSTDANRIIRCPSLEGYFIRYPPSSLLKIHPTTAPIEIASDRYASRVTAADPRPRRR